MLCTDVNLSWCALHKKKHYIQNIKTSMPSSRMRTARRLTVRWVQEGLPLEGDLPSEERVGVCLLGRGMPTPWHSGKTDPPVDRMTDACENTTFPQLRLRAVTISLARQYQCIILLILYNKTTFLPLIFKRAIRNLSKHVLFWFVWALECEEPRITISKDLTD